MHLLHGRTGTNAVSRQLRRGFAGCATCTVRPLRSQATANSDSSSSGAQGRRAPSDDGRGGRGSRGRGSPARTPAAPQQQQQQQQQPATQLQQQKQHKQRKQQKGQLRDTSGASTPTAGLRDEVRRCQSIQDIAALLARHPEGQAPRRPSDAAFLATRLSSIAAEASPSFVDDNLLQALLPRLYGLVMGCLEGYRGRDLAHAICGLAGLKFYEADQLQVLTEASKPHLGSWRAADLAGVVAALGRIRLRPSNAWLGAFMAEAQMKLPGTTPSDVSHLLWGLVQLGIKPTPTWLCSLLDAASGHAMATAPEQDLVRLATALAQARHTPPAPWLSSFLSAVQPRLAQLQPQGFVELLEALAELGARPSGAWMRTCVAASESALARYGPRQLAALLRALGRLQPPGTAAQASPWPPEAWLGAVLAAAEAQLPAFGARDVSELLSALAALQRPPTRRFMLALLDAAQARLPRFTARALVELLSSAVELEALMCGAQGIMSSENSSDSSSSSSSSSSSGGSSDTSIRDKNSSSSSSGSSSELVLSPAWMQGYLTEAAGKLPVYSAQELQQLLVALARAPTRCRPEPAWLHAAAQQLQVKLSVLEPAGLADAAWALGVLGWRPLPAWNRELLTAAQQCAKEFGAQDLQRLLRALPALLSEGGAGAAAEERCLAALAEAAQALRQRGASTGVSSVDDWAFLAESGGFAAADQQGLVSSLGAEGGVEDEELQAAVDDCLLMLRALGWAGGEPGQQRQQAVAVLQPLQPSSSNTQL